MEERAGFDIPVKRSGRYITKIAKQAHNELCQKVVFVLWLRMYRLSQQEVQNENIFKSLKKHVLTKKGKETGVNRFYSIWELVVG